MKNKYVTLGIILLCTLFSLIYFFVIYTPNKVNIICHGTLITKNDLASSKVRVFIVLHEKNGRVNFDGVASNNSNEETRIRRASSFEFKHYGNSYFIDKSNISELPGNTTPADLLIGMYPSFMLFNSNDYRFTLYRIGDEGYLFMSDKFVTLYCVR